jgi:transcriptional regulator with PAS, ATPase and Fis domain
MIWDETTLDERPREVGPDAPRAYAALVQGSGPALTDLPRGQVVSIGRSRTSGIPVHDDAVSRLHATLEWDGGSTVLLVDRASRNGTTVNGQRIDGSLAITSGTEVGVGGVRLVVVVLVDASDTGSERVPGLPGHGSIVVHDEAMLRVLALADRVARSAATVLLVGETGVGKEVVARRIHDSSARRDRPFVAINCGALVEGLAGSDFFGHEPGAFTGATDPRPGCFEMADGGTLLLDEVSELDPAMQVRLLRVLQEREVTRLGSTRVIKIDVRIIAATNSRLEVLVRAGRFREDLLFRLDVVRIEVPPLRERPAEIVPLARRFLRELAPGRAVHLSDAASEALRAYSWPGNIRELRNVIERSVVERRRDVLDLRDIVGLDAPATGCGTLRDSVDTTERAAITAALDACSGNQTRAARRLGISRRAFIYKLERFGLKPPPPSRRG